MKKGLMCLFLSLLFCTSVFASGQEENKSLAKTTGPITLTVLTTAVTQNPEGPLAQEFITAFMAANPNIKIEVTGVPMNQALQKITTLAAAGSLPDIFVNTENIVGKLADMGICEDLTPYMNTTEMNNIAEAVRLGSTVNGKFVMYPWYSAPNALIFRSDWFSEKGITPPTTLDEMLVAAQKLTGDNRYGFGLIGTNDDSGETRFVMILRSFGARELYQAADGSWKTDIGSPESIAAFKYFSELKNKYGVVPPGALQNSFNENVNLMAAEQIGMLLAGSNSVGKIFNANPALKGKLGSVQMPTGKTTYTPVSILGWSLSTECKEKEAAVRFMKFMSEKQNAIKWVEVTGRMPCTNDAVTASDYLNTPLFEGFVAGVNSMELAPSAPFYAEVKSELGKTYQKLLMDASLDVGKEVQACAKAIQNIIANNK